MVSALGHKQTFRLQIAMSTLSPKADMCAALVDVCYRPIADIRGPQSDVRMLICAGRPVSKRVQAVRGTTRGKANVDFDGLCFDCRDWRGDRDLNRSNFGSNFPLGQFARFLDVILRRARVCTNQTNSRDARHR